MAVCSSKLRLPGTQQDRKETYRPHHVISLMMQVDDGDVSLQCADIHVYMIDGGHVDEACQLTAATVINGQTQVVLDIMTSIIDDRVGSQRFQML